MALNKIGELQEWTRDEFAKRFQQPAADEYRRVRRLVKLDVSGTAASAVLTLDYPQVLFTDHMSLLKIGDQWKIVSKVFSADRRDAAQEAKNQILREWSLPFEPRKIIGNIYYVGTNLISSFLIVTPAGNLLLDTGHIEMLPQVVANIEKLGFRMQDIKILLNTHAHFDHCGGFAEFKRHTGVYLRAGRQNRARSKESCPNNVHRRSRSGQNETVQRPAVQDGIGNLLRSRKRQIISRAGGE